MDLTPEQKLLALKAARRWDASDKGRVAMAVLSTFGEVAADILKPQMFLAPFGFTQAIEVALRAVPLPHPLGESRDRAQALRAAWESEFLTRFQKEIP
jgi:hypothetical protein